MTTAKRQKRAPRGSGRLYKRNKVGKEFPSTSKVDGVFWLEHRVNGKRIRKALTDEDGALITTLKKAEAERLRRIAPYKAKKKADQLKTVQSLLRDEEQEIEEARIVEKLRAEKMSATKLSDAWGAYCKSPSRPRSSDRTLSGYEGQYRAFYTWMGSAYPSVVYMREVTPEHAAAYVGVLESRRLSPSTYNQHLNALALIWSNLSTVACTTQNPFEWDKKLSKGIRRKSINAEVVLRKKRALTLDELNAVISIAEGDYRSLLIVLACTGQRLVDGVKLKWNSIDFDKGIICMIPQKTARRTGKQVYIPILPQLRAELLRRKKSGAYVFPALVSEYDHDRGSMLTKNIRRIFDRAGLEAHKKTDVDGCQAVVETGAHSLRHSFVTVARVAGLPDVLIQQITGHSSTEMTDHYTQFSEKLVASLASRIPQALPAGEEFSISADEPKKLEAPLPDWARVLVVGVTAKNWKTQRAKLLEGRS